MATFVLVRHATTAATGKRLGGWTPDVHLDGPGIAQAQAAAERLAGLPIAAVYASPLDRTRETAKIVAKPHGLRVRTRRGIGEVDYGDWTDKPLGQLRRRKLWASIQATPSRVSFPGGESIRGAQHRAVDATETLATEHTDETIVLVSHADVIKAIVAHHLAMPLDAFQRLVISPASATILQLPATGHPVLLRCNDTGPITQPDGAASSTSSRAAEKPSTTDQAGRS